MLTPPAAIEALLFASGEAMEKKDIAKLLGIKEAELALALDALAKDLAGRGITMVESENEVELRTAPAASELVKQFRESELSRDLGKASLETLATIAYQEGATRGQVDWVRGVNSSASIRTLLMRGLIEAREDPSDKRRMRYTLTTDAFAHLGLSGSHELPRWSELNATTKEIVDAESLEPTPE